MAGRGEPAPYFRLDKAYPKNRAAPYAADQLQVITSVISHLGERFQHEEPPSDLEVLRELRWLPARDRNDRWYKPDELFAVYQDYLFQTQALFLDIPRHIQNSASGFLQFLGVRKTPETRLVVKHLLYSAEKNLPVHEEVYRHLNNHAEDPAIEGLQGNKCLYLRERECYLTPDQVFWADHPFGRYRHRLDESLRVYGGLFKKIGVCERPDHTDALSVIKEISAEFEKRKQPVDEQDLAVLRACWRLLETAVETECFTEKEAGTLRGIKCVPNTQRMLYPPEWIFFENRAGLSGKFGDFLAANVIPKPLDSARAMAMAGVRPLGTAVKVHVLECEDPVEDSELAGIIQVRRQAIARILDARIGSDLISGVLERLSDIRFQSARSLIIRYQLRAFNRELQSGPEYTPALYLPDEARLVFTKPDSKPPWAAIARELAVAMLPEQDPGGIAAGIKEVLAAETAELADRTLDDLGYPRLDTTTFEPPRPTTPISGFGTPDTGGETPIDEPSDGLRALPGGTSLNDEQDDTAAPEAGTPCPTEPTTGVTAVEPTTKRPERPSGTKKRKRPVLRSYLPAPDPTSEAGEAMEGKTGRSQVDAAGIERVLDYEKSRGRIPQEMPHHNPGYDIESRVVVITQN